MKEKDNEFKIVKLNKPKIKLSDKELEKVYGYEAQHDGTVCSCTASCIGHTL